MLKKTILLSAICVFSAFLIIHAASWRPFAKPTAFLQSASPMPLPGNRGEFRQDLNKPNIPEPTRTLYVSALKGSDSYDGTLDNPLRTISKALELAEPGDRILAAPGRYNERIIFPKSGLPDKPIILEGTRDLQGKWLTTLDGSTPFTNKWVSAPEIGPGVYKTTWEDREPFLMTSGNDYRQIPRICPFKVKNEAALEKMAYPSDYKVKTKFIQGEVNYWDIIEAMFAVSNQTVYLRFRDGDNPNNKILNAAPEGGVLNIENKSCLVIKNLFICGGSACVSISGPEANDNIVTDNFLLNGRERVIVQKEANRNQICFNDITAHFLSDNYKTGAWGGGALGENTPYELRVKEHFYNQYKYLFGANSTGDTAIRFFCAGADNQAFANHVAYGGQGISCYGQNKQRTERVKIHHNLVYGFSSIGIIVTLSGVKDIEVYDNLVYDNNINLRIHHVNEAKQDPGRSLYVYRNCFYQLPGRGTHIFFHYQPNDVPADYPHAEVWIYHNSFAGGQTGIGALKTDIGLPAGYILNNVISSHIATGMYVDFIKHGALGAWDYNWIGGRQKSADHDITRAAWYGTHNIMATDASLWDDLSLPTFDLPSDSPAQNTALNLAQPFELNGKTYDPLPGMVPGYFAGTTPDMGARQ